MLSSMNSLGHFRAMVQNIAALSTQNPPVCGWVVCRHPQHSVWAGDCCRGHSEGWYIVVHLVGVR